MFLVLSIKSIRSGEAFMTIVGCDFHPGWQQVAVFDSETGEIRELKLEYGNGEAEGFYGSLPSPVRVGIEACGNTQWFEDLHRLDVRKQHHGRGHARIDGWWSDRLHRR
jgi:hypothetical protein